MPGTDWWLTVGSQDITNASGATNVSGLDSWGWTTTALTTGFTNAVTADFLSSSDDTPPHILTNASGDVLQSPIMFGNYSHQLLVAQFLERLPNRLVVEFYAAFTVASANESATHIGLHNGAALVAAVFSDATNFQLSNGVTTDAGALVDNLFHQWRIVVDKATSLIEWFIDGISQGTVAITQDVWPAAFRMAASTTNRQGLSWVHIWYE